MSRTIIWPALIVAIFTALLLSTRLDIDESGPVAADNTNTTITVYDLPHVRLGGTVVYVEIADDPIERGKGLSGREGLQEGWGMLFIFEEPGRYSFWMYGMLFPLDIIWIDERGLVVYLVEKAQPCVDKCVSYFPESDALYVLEVRAGFAEEYNVVRGDLVEISLPTLPSPAR